MAIPGRAFLFPVRRADRTVHLEHDVVRPRPVEDAVDSLAAQIGERGTIALGRETFGLEPAHLRCRGCLTVDGAVADDLRHNGVTSQPLGIVDVFISGEAAINGLPEKPCHPVNSVRTRSGVGQRHACQIGEAEGVVRLSHIQQTAIRTEPQSPELQPHPATKIQPQIIPATRTRWVCPETRLSSTSTY